MDRITTHIKEMLEERGYNIEKELKLTFENGPFQKKQSFPLPEKEYIKIYMTKYMVKEKLDIHDFNVSKKEAKKISEEILKYIIVNTQPREKNIVIFPQELLEKFSPERILSLPVLSHTETHMEFKSYDKITIFSENDFKFNPTKNILVPKHSLASKEDKILLESRKIRKNDLPKISKNDTICRWYGFQIGDVVRIERNYSTTEKKIYYRYVS